MGNNLYILKNTDFSAKFKYLKKNHSAHIHIIISCYIKKSLYSIFNALKKNTNLHSSILNIKCMRAVKKNYFMFTAAILNFG